MRFKLINVAEIVWQLCRYNLGKTVKPSIIDENEHWYFLKRNTGNESESHSAVSASLWAHGLYTVQGFLQARILEWVALPFSRGYLPNPGVEPRSPTLKADSLPAEPQGSPRILGWVAYPFSSWSSWPRNPMKPEFPVLQADSLPTELSGKILILAISNKI